MIYGVQIKKLKWISDARGRLAEIFRQSEFGTCKQVYITTALPNVIKDKDRFHMHNLQEDRFCCIRENIRLVLVDIRKDSPTKNMVDVIELGEKNFCIVVIPPKILHAFQNLDAEEAWVLNCISNEYDIKNADEIRVPNKYWDWDGNKKIGVEKSQT